MRQILFTILLSFTSFLTMNAQETPKIKITIGDNSFVAKTYDNVAAQAFVSLLPLTITMNELNGNEKYCYLSDNLPNSLENPKTIHSGDLMLYGQNCIVLFYETFTTSYSYTKIGYIDNPIGLKNALGTNNPTITFELVKTTGLGSLKQNSQEFKISKDGILQMNDNAERLSLINMNGKTLLSSNSCTLDVKGIPNGIYVLLVENLYKTKAFKIII
jgi:hypothetical protein